MSECGVTPRALPRICVIAVYFGPLPAWFGLWLTSCAANPEIDFIFVSDQEVNEPPANMRVISESLADVRGRLANVCGTEVCLGRTYKLCDYKPFLGSAYAEELKGYDYWGFCDIDLVFGDLARYFRDLEVWRYDKFLPLGHLFLVRNEPRATELWRLTLRGEQVWRNVVNTEDNCAFDETSFNDICIEHGVPTCWEHPFADVIPRRKRFTLGARTVIRNGHFDYALTHYGNYNQQVFWWRDGRTGRAALVDDDVLEEEFMYVHFQKRHFGRDDVHVAPGDGFFLGAEGFYPMDNYANFRRIVALVNPYNALNDTLQEVLLYARALASRVKRVLLNDRR